MHHSVPPPPLPPDTDDLYIPQNIKGDPIAEHVWTVMRLVSTNTDFAWCTICRKWYRYRTDFNSSYIKTLFQHCTTKHTQSLNGKWTPASSAPTTSVPASTSNPSSVPTAQGAILLTPEQRQLQQHLLRQHQLLQAEKARNEATLQAQKRTIQQQQHQLRVATMALQLQQRNQQQLLQNAQSNPSPTSHLAQQAALFRQQKHRALTSAQALYPHAHPNSQPQTTPLPNTPATPSTPALSAEAAIASARANQHFVAQQIAKRRKSATALQQQSLDDLQAMLQVPSTTQPQSSAPMSPSASAAYNDIVRQLGALSSSAPAQPSAQPSAQANAAGTRRDASGDVVMAQAPPPANPSPANGSASPSLPAAANRPTAVNGSATGAATIASASQGANTPNVNASVTPQNTVQAVTRCECTEQVRKVAERSQQLMFTGINMFFSVATFKVPSTEEEAMDVMRAGTEDVDSDNHPDNDLYFTSWSHTQFFAAQMASLGYRFLSSNLRRKVGQVKPPPVEQWLILQKFHHIPRPLAGTARTPTPGNADVTNRETRPVAATGTSASAGVRTGVTVNAPAQASAVNTLPSRRPISQTVQAALLQRASQRSSAQQGASIPASAAPANISNPAAPGVASSVPTSSSVVRLGRTASAAASVSPAAAAVRTTGPLSNIADIMSNLEALRPRKSVERPHPAQSPRAGSRLPQTSGAPVRPSPSTPANVASMPDRTSVSNQPAPAGTGAPATIDKALAPPNPTTTVTPRANGVTSTGQRPSSGRPGSSPGTGSPGAAFPNAAQRKRTAVKDIPIIDLT